MLIKYCIQFTRRSPISAEFIQIFWISFAIIFLGLYMLFASLSDFDHLRVLQHSYIVLPPSETIQKLIVLRACAHI